MDDEGSREMGEQAGPLPLRPITADNWVDCVNLQVSEEQQRAGYVASNVLSLAQAHFEPWWQPLGIYAGETMVGFFLVGRWPDSGISAHHGEPRPGFDCILRMMVDARYQGKGYGLAALTAFIQQRRAHPGCRGIEISYEPGNVAAERLYSKAGSNPPDGLWMERSS